MMDLPETGDLVIHAVEGHWVLAVAPEPAQLRYDSLDAALAAAQQFARDRQLRIWQTSDGVAFTRVEFADS
jgi:hypothetical protein